MKHRYPLIALATAFLLGLAATATATTTEESAVQAEEAQLQAQLEAEYAKAIAEAEQERRSAEVSMEKAREQLQQVAEQRAQTGKENNIRLFRFQLSKNRGKILGTGLYLFSCFRFAQLFFHSQPFMII